MKTRESLADKLATARQLTGMSTRAVAEKLGRRGFQVSHATVANYEKGASVPPLDLLSILAELYDRPINWFLQSGRTLTAVRYRNLPSKVRVGDLHHFEADVKRWLDAYDAIETRLERPLVAEIGDFQAEDGEDPDDLARRLRRRLGMNLDDPIPSVIEVLHQFGIRVIEQETELRIDGLAAVYGTENIVALNSRIPNDRGRLTAAHELAHLLYGDFSGRSASEPKKAEERAFAFASHFILPNAQLKRAIEGQSVVRLVQFKERFGISLAAMVYRAESLRIITKATSKKLWSAFSQKGWKTSEPGTVRPDRATRFEQLLDEGIFQERMTMREAADLAGVRQEDIRHRLQAAMGITAAAMEEDGPDLLQFPK